MAWAFRYVLERAPEAKTDGSGDVKHSIHAEGSEDSGAWELCPGRHEEIPIPATELAAALAAGTNNQIVAAYKDALVANRGRTSVPTVGWTSQALEQLMENNQAAAAQAAAADTFITVTLGLTYPRPFTI